MRLDKYIAHSTGLSRKHIGRLIRAGAVSLDGEIERRADTRVSAGQSVELKDKTLRWPEPRYLMLHKPAGYVCTRQGDHQPAVLDLILPEDQHRLQIVGRLDKDTTGLLLLTDDGQWNHRLTSPRQSTGKTYHVITADPITADAPAQFADGLALRNEGRHTRPANLELLGEREARITLHEGRYHQVRRMFAALGNHVEALHRESVGQLPLDPALAPGEYRPLTAAEVAAAEQ